MNYHPIENYGIIGNTYTTALVNLTGSIDWFCFPKHDSPSVFAALIDGKKGGHFQISPCLEPVKHKQFYYPGTNVLVTRFFSPCGVGEIADFMPVKDSASQEGFHWLIRRVKMIRCSMKFKLECYPAFNYALDTHETILTDSGAYFKSSGLGLELLADVVLARDERGITAEFHLEAGETALFVLRKLSGESACDYPLDSDRINLLFEDTVSYWRRWLSQCIYRGRWREMVERSALVLKLLTYKPTGAIVAAPTCGLPEEIGGSRNWDYRYTWIRDAAFTLYALIRIGFTEEAAQFMHWLENRCYAPKPDGPLQLVYSIDGQQDLQEMTLDHLEGYRGSHPVRIGNGAVSQLQLDIYGELMDAVYLHNKYGAPISYNFWLRLRSILNWLCDNWQRDDEGIWEHRDGRKPFVYSKLMCWVALDRGLRLADKRSFPADREKWLITRDRIYEEIMEKGWSERRQSFVQYYDSEALDASSLIMPLVLFLAPNDPRMLKTLDAILQKPDKGGLVANNLVYRYSPGANNDGLDGEEGTFNLCTFWLVEAITRAGRIDPQYLNRSRLMFEEMLSYANHLGLYAEETGASGEALGNYPQAFTHLSLISAAWNLNRALDERR